MNRKQKSTKQLKRSSTESSESTERKYEDVVECWTSSQRKGLYKRERTKLTYCAHYYITYG